MSTLLLILGAFLVLALVRLAISFSRSRQLLRQSQTVVCPETGTKAAVSVDTAHAAWTAALGDAEYRLVACSHWPQKKDCPQSCFREVESKLDDRLGRGLPARDPAPTACSVCHRMAGEIRWFDNRPALLDSDAAGLPDPLPARRPLCWDCHVAETLGRLPALVTDEPGNRA